MLGETRKRKRIRKTLRKPAIGRSVSLRVFNCMMLFFLILFASHAAAQDMPVRTIDHGKLSQASIGQPSAVSGTQKGSASYAFSIPLPKFFFDFPLTLSYDSGSANAPGGEFGAGWSLSLPEVRRDITKDLLFFNGQLLIYTGYSGDYDEYHTIVENHQRIFFNIRDKRWEITSPDGTKMILAATATYSANRYVERWRISSIRLPLGHEIQFKYRSDYTSTSGYCYPYLSEISYLPLGKDPYPVATFAEPVPKDSNEMAYLNTHLMPITHRIESVTVKRGDARRSKYEFLYRQSQALNRSQFWKIKEFGMDDAVSRDTVFEYGPPLAVGLGEPFARNYMYGNPRIAFHHTGDFNLNGTQDYLALESAGNVKLVDGANACPGVTPCSVPYENWLSVGGYWDGKNGLARAGDINGDGLLDFMLITSAKYSMGEPWINNRMKRIYFWLSNGENFVDRMYDATRNQPVDWNINDDGSVSDDFFLMDLDGDGRADLVWISSVTGRPSQWARNKHPQEQFFVVNQSPFESFKPIQGLHWARGHMHTGDFNGDGLVDFYNDDSKVMFLNQRGSFIQKSWGDISVPSSGVAVGDVNRDGLDDLVFIGSRATAQGCQYTVEFAKSVGTGFNSFTPLGSKLVTDPLFTSWCDVPFNLSLQDADGDGDLDFVITYQSSGIMQFIIPNTSADGPVNQGLLQKITLPTGGSLSLEYAAAKSEWNTDFSSGIRPWRLGPLGFRPVLSKITMDDRMGNGTWIGYGYENGYYDVVTKEFRGFQRVIKTFPPHPEDFREDFPDVDVTRFFADGLKEFTWYHVWNQNYHKLYDGLAGKVHYEEFMGEDRSSYLHREYYYDSSQDPETGVFTTHLKEKKTYPCSDISGGECEVASTEYEWTQYGAVKRIYHYGFHYGIEKQAKSSEAYEYAENVGSWIVNKPYEKRIHKGKLGDLLVKESYGYDGNLVGVPPTQGKLTRKTVEDLTVKGRLLMGASAVTTTQYEHDPYGNVKKEISPEGKVTLWNYYANAYLFPYTKTVKVGTKELTATTLYDLTKDRLSTETDPNGHRTEYRYDRFGRIEKIVRPGDSEASPTQIFYYQDSSVPNYVQKTIKGADQNSTIERTYVDGLGRFKGTVAGKGVRGPSDSLWVQSQVTTYTVNGPKKWVYEPFVSTSPELVLAPTAPYTLYVYRDNHVTVVHHPDGNKIRYYHKRDGVRITDERQIYTFRYHDAFGNITEVFEDTGIWGEEGAQTQLTTYRYDELNHLIQSKDPRGVITEYQYDAFGRIRGINAPDTTYSKRNGYKVWYDYDGDGNQIYAWMGSEVIKNEYDDLGRLLKSSTSKTGGASFSPELVNVYDDGTLSQNSLGRLAKSQLSSGNVWYRYDYDERGRTKNQEVRLDANQFTMSYTYDSADRLLSMTDPQGKRIQYTYNRLGQLNTAWDEIAITYNGQTVVKAFGYNPRGQTTDIYYGHGLHMQYAYNARGWMTAMKDVGSLNLFQVNYAEYDPSGNLRHVKGHLNSYPFDYTYTYDNHRQLETASGTSGTKTIKLGYKYDGSGNFTEKTELDGITSIYNTLAGTNKLDTITPSGKRFFYNPHGHLLYATQSGAMESFGYDAKGRLVSFSRNNKSGQYTYDSNSRKVKAISGGQTTYYVYDLSGHLVATHEGTEGWTTFIYGNGQRLAKADQAGNLQYFHNDYLGSARLITEGPPFAWTAAGLSVSLSGPSALRMGQTGNFTASVSPKSGSYWYDWYKKLVDDSPNAWVSEGMTSTPEKTVKMMDDPMLVKVNVWDWEGLGYGSATYLVSVEYPNPKTGVKVLGTQSLASVQSVGSSSTTGAQANGITVVWFQDYLPYGERLAGTKEGNDFTFTGKERDENSGLFDYGARWYDPSLGRFIQLDSYLGNVFVPKTLNRHAYGLNNPLRYVDPTGNKPEEPIYWYQGPEVKVEADRGGNKDKQTDSDAEKIKKALASTHEEHNKAGHDDCADFVLDAGNKAGVAFPDSLDYSNTTAKSLGKWFKTNANETTSEGAQKKAAAGYFTVAADTLGNHIAIIFPIDSLGTSKSWTDSIGTKPNIISQRSLNDSTARYTKTGISHGWGRKLYKVVKFYYIKLTE